MATKKDQYGALYDLLAEAERNNIHVCTAELAADTGYKESSLKVYVRNKLRDIYLYPLVPQETDTYSVSGVAGMNRDDFIEHMRQPDTRASKYPPIVDRLIDCSISSFYLAIANYNNPAVNTRSEAFCLLIVNAWELLLKAFIIKVNGPAAVRTNDEHTIAISTAIQQVYPKPDNPCRGNLELMVSLRNQATHFVIEELCDYYARLFQSCIINYVDCLQNKMGVKGRLDLGSRGLIVTFDEATVVDLKTVALKYGKEVVDDFNRIAEDLRIKEESYNSSMFAIPVDYRVTVSRNAKDGVPLLRLDGGGADGYFLEIPKDPEKTHPFRETAIVAEIKKVVLTFNRTAFRAIAHNEGFKMTKTGPYHYHFEATDTHTYSHRLIEFIVAKNRAEPKYIEMCIAKQKREVAGGRKRRATTTGTDR